MSKVWFLVDGVGYKGFSGGVLHLITEDNNIFWYHPIRCQGTSTSCFGANDFGKVKNETANSKWKLSNPLNQMTIKFEVSDTFIFEGTIQMTLQIFDPADDGTLVFKAQQNFDAKGSSMGSVNILTKAIGGDGKFIRPESADEFKNSLLLAHRIFPS